MPWSTSPWNSLSTTHLEKNATQMPAISWRLTAHLPAPASPDNQPPKEPPQRLPESEECVGWLLTGTAMSRAAATCSAETPGVWGGVPPICDRGTTAHNHRDHERVKSRRFPDLIKLKFSQIEKGSHRAWYRWSHRLYPRRSNTPRRWRGRAGSTLGPRGKTSRRAL